MEDNVICIVRYGNDSDGDDTLPTQDRRQFKEHAVYHIETDGDMPCIIYCLAHSIHRVCGYSCIEFVSSGCDASRYHQNDDAVALLHDRHSRIDT